MAIKVYEINHKEHRQEYEITSRYETDSLEALEDGEKYREELYLALKRQINVNELASDDKASKLSEKPPNNLKVNIYSEK